MSWILNTTKYLFHFPYDVLFLSSFWWYSSIRISKDLWLGLYEKWKIVTFSKRMPFNIFSKFTTIFIVYVLLQFVTYYIKNVTRNCINIYNAAFLLTLCVYTARFVDTTHLTIWTMRHVYYISLNVLPRVSFNHIP